MEYGPGDGLHVTPESIWKNRPFVRLFLAQLVSLTGSGVTTVGLALFAHGLAGGPSAAIIVGNALMLRIVAFLVFSQPAGVLADRIDRRKMLVAADLARFGLLALFPFITTAGQVYALIFGINAVTAFFTPAYDASIPAIAGEQHYVKALSLSRVAVDAENVAAPALAAALVALAGVRWVFWFDAATYLVSAALVLSISFASQPQASRQRLSARLFLAEVTHGTRILLREPSLRQALLLSFAEAIAGAAAIVVTVVYVRDQLQGTNAAVGLAMSCVGVGSALVAIALARVTGRHEKRVRTGAALHGLRHRWSRRALLGGGFLLGVSLLPGALVPPFAIFSVLWMVNGAGQALIAIPSTTLLMEHSLEAERGRASAAHFALTHFFWLFSYPVVGHAAARWGAPATLTGAGVACLSVTIVAGMIGGGMTEAHSHADART
jgi:NRE family putative nickel resistance protein-like MFS transporter